jgi:hypothetical protein
MSEQRVTKTIAAGSPKSGVTIPEGIAISVRQEFYQQSTKYRMTMLICLRTKNHVR